MSISHWHTIRKPETVISLLRPRRPIAGATCDSEGCTATEVYRCAYRDREGSRCTSERCLEHSVQLNGAPFCRRHAAVMRILVPTQGTLVEMKMLPLVDDRALVLADVVADEISEKVLALLRERFEGEPGVYFAADLVPREHAPRLGHPSWERGWTCYDHRGYRTRACVRVPIQTSIVQLVLNDIPIVTMAAPRSGRRAELGEQLLEKLRAALFTPEEEDSDELPAVVAAWTSGPVEAVPVLAGEEWRK